jgi:hypothetical protein
MAKTCELCNSAPAVARIYSGARKGSTEVCESCRERVVLEDLELVDQVVEEDKRRRAEFNEYLDGVTDETEYLARLRQALRPQRQKDGGLGALGRFAAETQRRMDAGTDEQFLRSCGIRWQ